MKKYTLPELPYGYKELQPFLSEELLTIHHTKHHRGYVDGNNKILEAMEEARQSGKDLDMKKFSKELSFNLGGHILHSLFWNNMAPAGKGGEPEGNLKEILETGFGSVEEFKKEFNATALSAEGSAWAALVLCPITKQPLLTQIEKHNVNMYPQANILLVLDVWEHAFYLDYKNVKKDFVEGFWKAVNWKEVSGRLEKIA